jgi:hypothetical protein
MAAPAGPKQNPWLVVLTVALAATVLALVAIGLRAVAGRNASNDVVEVPARRDIVPPPSSVSPSTTRPAVTPSTRTPSTTAPGGTTPTTGAGSTPTPVPGSTPASGQQKVSDLDGRFAVTLPRNFVNLPTAQPDQAQWVPFVPLPNGDFGPTGFIFAVRWVATEGCALTRCADAVVERMKATYPGINPTVTADTAGGLDAVRIEAETSDQRLVAWVVVKGDRYWVPQLRGPPLEFDVLLAVVRPVVASMSFD